MKYEGMEYIRALLRETDASPVCGVCGGTGQDPANAFALCEMCDGFGRLLERTRIGHISRADIVEALGDDADTTPDDA